MSEDCARGVLRLMAVAVVLIGVSMTIVTIVGFLGAGNAMANMPSGMQLNFGSTFSRIGLFTVLAYMAVSGVGFGLFLISGGLARKIVE